MKTGLFNLTNRNRRRRGAGSAADLDITPMIDVTFLLLIFFMVTSTMQSTPDLDLPVAVHGEGIDNRQQVVISVEIQQGRILLRAGDPPAPEVTREEIQQYVQQELRAGKTGILLKASGQVPAGEIKQLTQNLQQFGSVQFYYGVSEQEKK